ncbi:MAG: aminopeptidase [Ktedonobacteraceae bacterium]
MADTRHQKLAKVLVHYSLNIKSGDKFLIHSPVAATPLVKEVYSEAIQAGAYVTTRMMLDELDEILLRAGSEEQLTYISAVDKLENEHYDVFLGIWASQNTRSLSLIDPKRLALRQKAFAPLSKQFLERAAAGKLRWCGTLYPTQAHAQDAGMSLSDYENFVFSAGLLDLEDPAEGWRKVQEEQQHIADYLGKHHEIHIVAPDTDITYHVGGRTWISCAGTKNFPDGEVFTGPVEDSVNGTVRFTYPAVYNGNEVEDVRLTFRDGKVMESSASRGLEFLNAMLEMDEGARFLGEVAFGLNYNIKQFSKDTLFDEKIGGTMHMALGESYPETGGKNESGLHWDMVCDLHEGKVYADSELCYEAGKFII